MNSLLQSSYCLLSPDKESSTGGRDKILQLLTSSRECMHVTRRGSIPSGLTALRVLGKAYRVEGLGGFRVFVCGWIDSSPGSLA